jgi:hypothetical protein
LFGGLIAAVAVFFNSSSSFIEANLQVIFFQLFRGIFLQAERAQLIILWTEF